VIPAAIVLVPQVVHHCCQNNDDCDLHDKVETNLNTTNALRFVRRRFLSHRSQPPFTRLECLIGEDKHDDCHAKVENHRPGVDLSTRQGSHLLDGGKITKQLAGGGTNIEKNK